MPGKGKPFVKGDSRIKPGRDKGVPNKVTKAVNTFITEVAEDPEVQESFRQALIDRDKGSLQAYLGVVAQKIGKPKETVQVDTTPNMARLITMAIQALAQEKKG